MPQLLGDIIQWIGIKTGIEQKKQSERSVITQSYKGPKISVIKEPIELNKNNFTAKLTISAVAKATIIFFGAVIISRLFFEHEKKSQIPGWRPPYILTS